MIKFIDSVLMQFKDIFKRTKSFNWFVITILGLIISNDGIGVTSIIRELYLNPKCYESLIHFFRSRAWCISEIVKKWTNIVESNVEVPKVNGMNVLIGDGVKQVKEAKKMPGVKKHHQESENSSKAKYIFGHMFGVVSLLIGNGKKQFALPLSASIQDGVDKIRKFDNCKSSNELIEEGNSHVVEVIKQAGEIAKEIGKSIVLLDRYFLSVKALKEMLKYINESREEILEIVTKAKITCKAYMDPPEYKGKGRPAIKGIGIKVRDLFITEKDKFKKEEAYIYGKMQEIEYYCIDLLWGVKLYKKLRFVLVKMKNYKPCILVSTSLSISAIEIIELYSYRFKIEIGFKTMKKVVFGFCYHFWSKHMPKLNRYNKEKNDLALETIDEVSKKNILDTLKAIEIFVTCACISTGLLQMISLKFSYTSVFSKMRWLRTRTNTIVTEETVAYFLRKYFNYFMYKHSNLAIMQIIISKQASNLLDESKIT